MCSCLMHTKVASGKLVMHDIPHAFSGVCIRLDNSLRKSYSVLLRYSFHAQILSLPFGHLSTSTRLWASLVVESQKVRIHGWVSLNKACMDPRHMQLNKTLPNPV